MAEHPSWPVRQVWRPWMLREPLSNQWAAIAHEHRNEVLDFWIRAAESDEWTFSQLEGLVDRLMDTHDFPPILKKWSHEVTARRRKPPSRTGPKSDPRNDFRTMVDVMLRSEFGGMSQRAAHREIGKETNRSESAVESAARRGGRYPRGAV